MSHEPKILIVDDDPTLCKSLKVFLGDKYSDIVTAFSGKEAIELLASDTFDLILLDVFMPDMNGYQVMDYIKKKGFKNFRHLNNGICSHRTGKGNSSKGRLRFYDEAIRP